jgi:methionyl-tRNA synthetase
MAKKNHYYLTTTLPYVNADPHIGFALEIVQADVIARYHQLLGEQVFFNTGTDEHGVKIYRKALEQNKEPQSYVDEYAAKFDNLKKALNLNYNNFIRTTDPHHIKASQEFWKRCNANGDIYKKLYKIKYCTGCELEKTDSELVEGKCPLHPNQELEIYEEENYFFRFSKYQDKLLELYKNNSDFVVPSFRLKEIETFVREGLQDFSISRLKSKMPWGIDVPDDSEHTMYVWFDALINYISAIGWPDDMDKFNSWWPVTQFAGKDNLRQQSAIWQAMLMSAELPPSKQILIHGFITANGQKMSKSLGNVINPFEVIEKYGTDATRYYLLAKVHPFEDSDFTDDKLLTVYNADLANGLGNTVARIAKLCERIKFQVNPFTPGPIPGVKEALSTFRFDNALDLLWNELKNLDVKINKEQPWKYDLNTMDGEEKLASFLLEASVTIIKIATQLWPFLPETSTKILDQFTNGPIKSTEPLFPRLNK